MPELSKPLLSETLSMPLLQNNTIQERIIAHQELYWEDREINNNLKLWSTVQKPNEDKSNHTAHDDDDTFWSKHQNTNHHKIPAKFPEEAYSVIHPLQNGCQYPFKGLTGSGVAFKLAHALIVWANLKTV